MENHTEKQMKRETLINILFRVEGLGSMESELEKKAENGQKLGL